MKLFSLIKRWWSMYHGKETTQSPQGCKWANEPGHTPSRCRTCNPAAPSIGFVAEGEEFPEFVR